MSEKDKHLPRFFCDITLRDKLIVNEGLIVLPEQWGVSHVMDDPKIVWPRHWEDYKDWV